MSITIEQLKVLVSVNASGSFSKAAELLGQTPSAVSKKVSQLEAQLGASHCTLWAVDTTKIKKCILNFKRM